MSVATRWWLGRTPQCKMLREYKIVSAATLGPNLGVNLDENDVD